jgi:hypothetical protein
MKCSTDNSGLRTQGSQKRIKIFLISAFCVLSSELAPACPLCKDALSEGMAKGFFWSILLMLSVPALVVGVIAGVVWRAERQKRQHPDVPHA